MQRVLWQAGPSGTANSACREELPVGANRLVPGQTVRPFAGGLVVTWLDSSTPNTQVLFLSVRQERWQWYCPQVYFSSCLWLWC